MVCSIAIAALFSTNFSVANSVGDVGQPFEFTQQLPIDEVDNLSSQSMVYKSTDGHMITVETLMFKDAQARALAIDRITDLPTGRMLEGTASGERLGDIAYRVASRSSAVHATFGPKIGIVVTASFVSGKHNEGGYLTETIARRAFARVAGQQLSKGVVSLDSLGKPSYDESRTRAKVNIGGREVILTLGSNVATVGKTEFQLPLPPVRQGNRWFVSSRLDQ